jgi:hypothetical protein
MPKIPTRTTVTRPDGPWFRRAILLVGGLCFLATACDAPQSAAPEPAKPAASAPAPAPPPLDLRGGAGGTGQAVYPTPVEVTGCLELVAASENDRAAEVCARAHQLEPGNADVRAAVAKLQGE